MPVISAALMSVASAVRVSRRVAVIGGGSGGVVAARFLKKAGHEPVLFEAGETFGGVWADEPTNDVVYKHLQTNLPTVVMQSPDLDFAPGLPSAQPLHRAPLPTTVSGQFEKIKTPNFSTVPTLGFPKICPFLCVSFSDL